jgi:hypothetical protein
MLLKHAFVDACPAREAPAVLDRQDNAIAAFRPRRSIPAA